MEKDIMQIVNDHEEWRFYNCINLIPSENITSPQVRAILSSDMGHRYTHPCNMEVHGSLVENSYRGTKFTDEAEEECRRLACRVYKSKFACAKPLSGHISAMISLIAAMKKGDRMASVAADKGGYDGYGDGYFPDILGYKNLDLPFDEKTWRLDTEQSVALIKKTKPKSVILGQSFILFPYDLDVIRNACNAAKSHLLYDASHVLGLIAGGQFQPEPLAGGVDLLYGSTHKTFFGPQGGIILTNNDELFERIEKNITWRTMDNAHWNRVAALAQALAEMEKFGAAYARQTVQNARVLGKALFDRGFPVKFREQGFTDSHQLAIDLKKLSIKHDLETNDLAKVLEKNNIITDAVGRIGTNEITRLGMKEPEMERLAELIAKVLKEKEKANVIEEVRLLRKDFEIEYCFK